MPIQTDQDLVQNSRAFLEELFRETEVCDFAVRLWDGTTLISGERTRFTLVLQHPGALRRIFESPTELSLGEAYIYNHYDLEGDAEMAARLGQRLAAHARSLRERLRLRSLLMALPSARPNRDHHGPRLHGKVHSKARDRHAIQYHYNFSNDFYRLFLDQRMIYSPGCFDRPEETLDTAQLRKLEDICRALRLQKGERFLDIGCGWGGLMIHAAHNFGVEALGLTLSETQAGLARERLRQVGLEHRCRVEVRDYRDLEPTAAFDKVCSIGMMEHVGAKHLPEYFERIWRLLRPGGALYNSAISRPVSEPARRPGSFTDAYVFPDGELEPIHEVLAAAEMAGFEVHSLHNTREDYAQTLRHWVRRLESHADEARRITSDVKYRVWRLYMAGSAARFQDATLHNYEILFFKPGAEPT